MAFRVPSGDVSVVDLTARLKTPTTYEEICAAIREASETYLKGVLTYTGEQVVSADLIGNDCPSVFDVSAGIMLDEHFVKLIAWYDNEWGYTHNLCELIKHMARVDAAN